MRGEITRMIQQELGVEWDSNLDSLVTKILDKAYYNPEYSTVYMIADKDDQPHILLCGVDLACARENVKNADQDYAPFRIYRGLVRPEEIPGLRKAEFMLKAVDIEWVD
jgi:hypothetical protein